MQIQLKDYQKAMVEKMNTTLQGTKQAQQSIPASLNDGEPVWYNRKTQMFEVWDETWTVIVGTSDSYAKAREILNGYCANHLG